MERELKLRMPANDLEKLRRARLLAHHTACDQARVFEGARERTAWDVCGDR